MRAIIVANGYVENGETAEQLLAPGDVIIAADGGALVAQQLGLQPQVVIGDLDSLPGGMRTQLQQRGCRFIDHPARKDETDTELAIQHALEMGAEEIVLLGAVGGRLDHTLANVLLLGMAALEGVTVRMVTGNTDVWLIRAGEDLEIHGQPGDTVTLLPLGQDAAGITTTGLEWALDNDTLYFGPARGVSNLMTAETARVALREGLLLALRIRGAE
jgi:thiamine pyrophosphokinase